MPIVPVVDPSTSQMPAVQAPSVAPVQDHSPEQTQRLGATLQQAGEQSMRTNQNIGLRIQEQLDDANVKAAETKFIQFGTERMHGQNGYMNTRGADAINGLDGVQQDFIKAKKDILDTLGNDVQKHMFDQVATQHLVTFGGQISQHKAQQQRDYTVQQSLSRADAYRTLGMSEKPDSPEQNVSIEVGVNELAQAFATNGVPRDSDQFKEAERKYRGQWVKDNVSRQMEDGDYAGANAYLTKEMQASHIDGDSADTLRRAIRGNLLRTEAIQTTEELFAPYRDKQIRTTDLEEMLQAAQKVDNPEQRKHVEDMLRAKYDEAHTIQVQKYRDNYNDVVNQLVTNGGNVRKVDAVKWGMLEPKDQDALMPKPAAVQTDLNTWYSFRTQPETLTLPNVNEAYSKGLLSKGDYKSFVEDATRLKNKPEYVQEAGDVSQRINFMANQAGLNVYGTVNGSDTKQTPADKIQHGQLTYAVQNEIERVKQQNHGKITGPQVDEIIKKELTQRILQSGPERSPWNPLVFTGIEDRIPTVKKRAFELPHGATHVVPGSDGKMHYTDGQNDLGVVQ